MKLGMYITAPEPISMTQLKNPSHQSMCLYVYPRMAVGYDRGISLPGNGPLKTLLR
jgi:hypothetical protein